ncbi:hypothetical protein PCS_01114 [Desulfocurvibacter africanus PCS]|uniref:Type IV pilus biogenesis n=1 Tax=Desulfocurvibacter africanus PCS TaxID=1262666 RepID=M5PUQ5_DESAF|nr:hypothetical protein [Desulfocurvibacter africanus]EMG38067.1 hypothetical protein PCS_01114 [Desulfocurvibacter africanus PCS]
MTKREKVLIALTVVAALGSGAMLLASPASRPPDIRQEIQAEIGQIPDVMAELQSLTGRQPAGVKQPVDLQAALESWAATDPFQSLPAQPDSQAGKQDTPAEPKATMAFNGYMEAGAFRLAIIDGLEYQVGDLLPDGEYHVAAITKKAVILKRTHGGERVTLPYTGDE